MSIKLNIKKVLSQIIGYNNFTKINLLRLGGFAYTPIINYADIDGWFTPKEAIALFNTAKKLPIQNPKVCEIGTWQGKSTLILAKAIIRKINPIIYCIDPFNADGDLASIKEFQKRIMKRQQINLKTKFLENMKVNKVDNIIRVIQGYSYDVVKYFSDKLDLLFIDGNHDYQFVLQDMMQWSIFLKIGGYIVFHDATEPGPKKVIDEYIKNRPNWADINIEDSLFIAKKVN